MVFCYDSPSKLRQTTFLLSLPSIGNAYQKALLFVTEYKAFAFWVETNLPDN